MVLDHSCSVLFSCWTLKPSSFRTASGMYRGGIPVPAMNFQHVDLYQKMVSHDRCDASINQVSHVFICYHWFLFPNVVDGVFITHQFQKSCGWQRVLFWSIIAPKKRHSYHVFMLVPLTTSGCLDTQKTPPVPSFVYLQKVGINLVLASSCSFEIPSTVRLISIPSTRTFHLKSTHRNRWCQRSKSWVQMYKLFWKLTFTLWICLFQDIEGKSETGKHCLYCLFPYQIWKICGFL